MFGIKENWSSGYHTIVEQRNSVGSAELYGWIGYKVKLSRNNILDHLLVNFIFYTSGNYWRTTFRPWARITTGDILRFVW